MQNSIIKSPRLYTELDLAHGMALALTGEQAHYLKNVLRKDEGDLLRVFNGRDGEWACRLSALNKKTGQAEPQTQIKPQPAPARRVHLYFAPIKKNRMDFLIEKAVELGVSDLHPVLTQNTETRKINAERLRAQMIEAAEQCERLDLPVLHPMQDLFAALHGAPVPVLAALERGDHPDIRQVAAPFATRDIAGLIGPEGGFTQPELERMAAQQNVHGVSFGAIILRSETAVVKFLCSI